MFIYLIVDYQQKGRYWLEALNDLLNCNKDEDGNPIFSFSNSHGSWYGKPGFPVDTDSYDIYDYIGEDSIGFFTTLGLDVSFLEENVEKREQLDSYFAAEAAVKNRKVVKDSPERV